MAVQGEHLHPCGEFHGQLHNRAPDLVLVEAVQRKVLQAGVFRDADAVLAAGAAAVAQFEVGQLPMGGVGGQRGDPQPVAVGEAQLGARVRALFSHDHPHPVGPAGQVEHAGRFGDPGAITHLPVGVVGRGPRGLGDQVERGSVGIGHEEPDRIRQPPPVQVVDEFVGTAGGVGPYEYFAADPVTGLHR
jgi:hypothetical protein